MLHCPPVHGPEQAQAQPQAQAHREPAACACILAWAPNDWTSNKPLPDFSAMTVLPLHAARGAHRPRGRAALDRSAPLLDPRAGGPAGPATAAVAAVAGPEARRARARARTRAGTQRSRRLRLHLGLPA